MPGFGDDGPVEAYELIDAGGGARLERFGEHTTDRPHGGAYGERRAPERWEEADLRFDRDGGWSGPGLAGASEGWTATIGGLDLGLRPTDAGQVGCFPEHAALLPWLRSRVQAREGADPQVLNSFASTGLVTLALAGAGAAVVHVDASRPAVAWARENARQNGLAEAPVRWIVDDVAAFVAREARRGRRYDGLVLDPPSYGHGPGRTWRLDRDLSPLLEAARSILADGGFVLLTAHTTGLGSPELAGALADAFEIRGADVDQGDLVLHAESGATLALGAFARVDGA